MTTNEATNPDMAEMMEACARFAIPGAGHDLFKKLEGRWTAKLKMWMGPSAPPIESEGTTEFKLIFGGRYLIQEYQSDFGGQPFEGMCLIAYDNYRRQYQNVWIDSMGTSLLVTESAPGASGDTIECRGTMDNPGRDLNDMPIRTMARMVDKDTHVFEMYSQDGDGKESQHMEITYRRA
jgi:hypothetical protein